MMKKRKFLALLLVLAMSLTLLAGCGGGNDDEGGGGGGNVSDAGGNDEGGNDGEQATSGPQELIVGCANDIGSMYPFGSATSGVKVKRIMCYETLFWLDYDGELQPILAKSYTELGDGKYEIELFDYIKDSAGNPMTADDLIFTLDRYIEDGQNLSTYSTLTDYHKTGDYTIELTYSPEYVGQFETLITNMHCITQKAWEDSGDEMAAYPVGTGGYTLNDSLSTAGSFYVFEKRDDYWQTDEQYINDYNRMTLDKLTLQVYTDASAMAVDLEGHTIDFACDISATDQQLFTDDNGDARDGYIKLEGANNAFTHILFNCGENSPTQDIKLRQAICYAISAADCAYKAYGVFGQVCTAATNPNLSDAVADLDRTDYFTKGSHEEDIEYAKQLVEESSYNGETLVMLVQPIKTVSDCAPLIQQYCAEIGVKIELDTPDMALYRTTRTDESGTKYDMELYGAAGAGDTYVYASLKELDGKNYSNGISHIFTEDEKLQELYDTMSDASTHSEESVKAFLDHLEENCYVYGMYYCPKLFFGRDYVVNAKTVIYLDAVFTAIGLNK